MAKDFPHLVQIALWPLILRHGHCISDTRFGDVAIALDDAKHSGGVWNEDDIVQKVREHDAASRENRPADQREEISLRRSKGKYANVVEIPDIQSTNAITYDRASDQVILAKLIWKFMVV